MHKRIADLLHGGSGCGGKACVDAALELMPDASTRTQPPPLTPPTNPVRRKDGCLGHAGPMVIMMAKTARIATAPT